MKFKHIVNDLENQVIRITDYDLNTIDQASRRLNDGDFSLSQHEYAAAAIVNGRLDLLGDADFRRYLVRMGRGWAHATVVMIFDHWEREMQLPSEHPRCPVGDQRIFTRD